MLAAQHIAGFVVGLTALGLCGWGLLIDPRVRRRWPFLVPGVVLGAAAAWLVSR